jgi:hypothetical protein
METGGWAQRAFLPNKGRSLRAIHGPSVGRNPAPRRKESGETGDSPAAASRSGLFLFRQCLKAAQFAQRWGRLFAPVLSVLSSFLSSSRLRARIPAVPPSRCMRSRSRTAGLRAALWLVRSASPCKAAVFTMEDGSLALRRKPGLEHLRGAAGLGLRQAAGVPASGPGSSAVSWESASASKPSRASLFSFS